MAIVRLEKIEIDLDQYEIRLHFPNRSRPVTLLFNSHSRKFYLSIIAFIVIQMKKRGDSSAFIRIKSHSKVVRILDKGLSENNVSKDPKARWEKIRKAWSYRLSDLALASLFEIKGKSKAYFEEGYSKSHYACSEDEKETWCNLIEEKEKASWYYRFSVNRASMKLEDVVVRYDGVKDNDAWNKFYENIKYKLSNEGGQRDFSSESGELKNGIIAFLNEVIENNKYIPLLHLQNEVFFEDQFIPIRVALERRQVYEGESSLGYAESDAELTQCYALKGYEDENLKKSVDWEKIRNNSRIMVLADPGMGKSTLLQMEASRAAKRAIKELELGNWDIEDVVLPLQVRMNDFDMSERDILKTIVEIACANHPWTLPNLKDILKKKLKRGKCLLLMDGLDEVPIEIRTELYRNLNPFLLGYKGNIICTSRIAGYSGAFLENSKEVEIVPFGWEQIEHYVRKLFKNLEPSARNEAPTANAFVSELRNKPQIRGLAQSPLLLSMLCRLYQEGELVLPARRSQVYEMASNYMLNSIKHRDLKLKREIIPRKKILEEIAYQFMTVGKIVFSGDELYDVIEKYLRKEGISRDIAKLTETRLIHDLSEEFGIIVNSFGESDSYTFFHRIFQEFFSACYLKRVIENDKDVGLELVEKYIWDFDWHDTLCLLSGVLEDPLPFIKSIVYENRPNQEYNKRNDDIFNTLLDLSGKCIAECDWNSDLIFNEIVDNTLALWLSCPYLDYVKSTIFSMCQTHSYVLKKVIENDKITENMKIECLKKTCTPEAVSILIKNAMEEDSRFKHRVVVALGEIGTPEAALAIVNAIRAKRRYVRDWATRALVNSGIITHEVVSALITFLQDEDKEVKNKAADALGRIGALESVPALINALQDEDKEVKRSAVYALNRIGTPEAIEALINALRDGDNELKKIVEYPLMLIRTPEAVPVLMNALQDRDKVVKLTALDGLSNIAKPESVPALINALQDEDKEVKNKAANALKIIGTPEAIEAVRNVLRDDDKEAKASAAFALKKIGAPESVSELINVLQDEGKEVKRGAANALKIIGTPEAIEAVRNVLRDGDKEVKESAAYALGKIGALESVSELTNALQDDDKAVKVKAVNALRIIGTPEAIEALKNVLRDGDREVKESAAYALGEIGAPEVVSALTNVLKDEDKAVRLSAVIALGKIGTSAAAEALTNALQDGDKNVKKRAAKALRIIGTPETVPALIKMLNSEDSTIRKLAADVLSRSSDPSILEAILKNVEIGIYDSHVLVLVRKLLIRYRNSDQSFHPLYPEMLRKYKLK
jgi:HEAT repeat protein